MTIEYIRYKVLPEQSTDFVAAYQQAAAQLEQSPYCLAYELSACDEEPGQFILRIEWSSADDHMNGFRKGAHFPPFFALVKPFFSNIQEMRHYTSTAVAHRKGSE